MNNALAVVNEVQDMKPVRVKIWRECPLTEDVIFKATDECGRSGWFLRLTISGLYPRRVGPYRTKEQAIEILEEFIADVEVNVLCELENDVNVKQAYVIEWIPMLNGPCAQKGR